MHLTKEVKELLITIRYSIQNKHFEILKLYPRFSFKILTNLLFDLTEQSMLYHNIHCLCMFLHNLRPVLTIIYTASTNSNHLSFLTIALTFGRFTKIVRKFTASFQQLCHLLENGETQSGPNRGLSFSATIGLHVPRAGDECTVINKK